MMRELSVDDMLNGKANKYALAVAVAKLARKITDDAELHGEILEEKPVNIATRDFVDHKYKIMAPE